MLYCRVTIVVSSWQLIFNSILRLKSPGKDDQSVTRFQEQFLDARQANSRKDSMWYATYSVYWRNGIGLTKQQTHVVRILTTFPDAVGMGTLLHSGFRIIIIILRKLYLHSSLVFITVWDASLGRGSHHRQLMFYTANAAPILFSYSRQRVHNKLHIYPMFFTSSGRHQVEGTNGFIVSSGRHDVG